MSQPGSSTLGSGDHLKEHTPRETAMLVTPEQYKGRIVHLTCLALPSGAPEPWAHLKFKWESL